ncbi:MAG TPA: hypothetical protein DCY53_02020 [Desulfobacteraceae bacterium]|nr:hypothetical protein [Desulfobacteraceae bacterium]
MVSKYDINLNTCKTTQFFTCSIFIGCLKISKALRLKARPQYLVSILFIPVEKPQSNPTLFFLFEPWSTKKEY